MSRTIHSQGVRALALVALLGGARLVAPAIAHAQSIDPERALLNRTAVVSSAAVTAGSISLPAVDGERALLGRSVAGVTSQAKMTGPLGDAGAVDGERALLGKIAPSETRRLTLAL